jgi:hypothetical protein
MNRLFASASCSYVQLREHLNVTRVYLGHTCYELRGQVPAAEVGIEQCGLNAAMAGERGDLVYVPARARKVGQAETT